MSVTLSQVVHHSRGDFLQKMFTLAIPITLQSILFSSKGLIDVIMIGQLSEASVAAIGVASRAIFVTTIMIGGITTGGALLVAQYWGAKDNQGVTESTALTWLTSSIVAIFTVALFWFFPAQIMSLATDSPEIKQLGVEYLQITSFSMISIAFVSTMAAGLRSMHKPMISTLFSGFGIILNIILNYLLIFGFMGFPAMGIKGAALATLISSMVEVVCLYLYLYLQRHLLAFSLTDILISLDLSKVKRFLALSLPTTFNFLTWAAGLFTYTAIMGQTGEQGLVALSVMTPVEAISLSLLVGIANASAVIIGNQLGAKRFEQAYYQAIAFAFVGFAITLVVAILLYLFQTPILNSFTTLGDSTYALSQQFLVILCFGIVLRSVPTVLVVGVLRAGGDVKFCLYQDMSTQWLFGIPIAAIAAIYFGFSPQWVYALFFIEAIFKWFACIHRLRSKKWINNLIEK